LSVKVCGVCGGQVRPLDDQSVFGCCEGCGIVYALKGRLAGARDARMPGRFGTSADSGLRGPETPGGVSVGVATSRARPPGSYWRCPDCDSEIHADNDSDLEFAKREHVREFHPNRTPG